MDKKVFFELLDRWLAGKASQEERTLLEAYYERLAAMPADEIPDEEMEAVKAKMFDRIKEEEMNKPASEPAIIRRIDHPKPVQAKVWRRIAVAASVVLVVGIGSYILYSNKTPNQTSVDKVTAKVSNDVKAPSTNRATITLSNGKVVYLDSVANGTLAIQGTVVVEKKDDGKIVYSQSATANGEILYNTVVNPKGSKVIDMTLGDGSRVWLNAGSTMVYPIAFGKAERKVTIDGEAYFEVAHDKTKPFKVGKGGMEVTVLGTHFNINAYDNEREIKVTLLEGSIKTSIVDGPSLMVKPGEQAILRQTQNDKGITLSKGVDVEQVMAWKNGLFNFKDANIENIMRQVERWYDVEIVYTVDTKGLDFSGVVARKENVTQLLKIIELTGLVDFKIDGRKITVEK